MTQRGEQMKAERRRRADDLGGGRKRLSVNMARLDRETYAYRWVNDTGNRLHQFTVEDDWELVPDRAGELRANSTGAGTEVAVHAGTGEHGKPVKSVLLRKRRDWFNDDYDKAQRRIDDTDAALKQGNAPGGDMDQTYVPGGKSAMNVSVST